MSRAGPTRRNGPLSRRQREALRRSVSDLRAELEGRFGSDWQRRGAAEEAAEARRLGRLREIGAGLEGRMRRLDVSGRARELRSMLRSYGMHDRPLEIDEFGMDSLFLDRARGPLDFLYDRWWRVRVSGQENLPRRGRALFVANRSGILPYDGLMIAHATARERPDRPRTRFLVADWIATSAFTQPLLARLGGVRACPENAERLLRGDHWVVAFPEGQKGAFKPFHQRYELQRFARGGFVSLALRLDAELIPVAVVGAEETHPILFRLQLASRLFGVPLMVTPTFPMLGPLGLLPLPSQWGIRFGEPIRWDGVAREKADDPLFINRIRDRVRSSIQTLLERELAQRSGVFHA